MRESNSLFNTPESWANEPLEVVMAWLLRGDFVARRDGNTQALRASSAAVYSYMSRKFVREVLLKKGIEWSEVEAGDVAEFLAAQDLKREMWNRYVRLLERLFDYLQLIHVAQSNPARGLARKAAPAASKHNDATAWLDADQMNRVIVSLEATKTGSWKDKRNRALIAVMLGCGLRVSEVIALPVKSLSKGEFVEVKAVGAGRAHKTKLAPWTEKIVAEWLRDRPLLSLVGDLAFPAKKGGGLLNKATVYRWVAKLLAEAGVAEAAIKRRGGRTLRNTFALSELQAGQPEELVGEFLGHRADRSTRYYSALAKRTRTRTSTTVLC